MKVYLVLENGDYVTEQVFATKELAEKFIAAIDAEREFHVIVEAEVRTTLPEMQVWTKTHPTLPRAITEVVLPDEFTDTRLSELDKHGWAVAIEPWKET